MNKNSGGPLNTYFLIILKKCYKCKSLGDKCHNNTAKKKLLMAGGKFLVFGKLDHHRESIWRGGKRIEI